MANKRGGNEGNEAQAESGIVEHMVAVQVGAVRYVGNIEKGQVSVQVTGQDEEWLEPKEIQALSGFFDELRQGNQSGAPMAGNDQGGNAPQ